MNPSIPASDIVSVTPGVIGAGGDALDLSGLALTTSTRVPYGAVRAFASLADVASYFGSSSDEAAAAAIYFNGFDNSNVKPAQMLFAQYAITPIAAWLRGGSVASMTLTELQALSGTVNITVDGYARASGSFSLSSATSFSSAAGLIETALNSSPVTAATSTASTISGTTLTVGGSITGTFAVGQTLSGSGVTADSVITSLGTGTGGAGTYNLSQSSTVGVAEAIAGESTPVVVTYDSVSGGFLITSGITGAASSMAYATGTLAGSLKLNAVSGALISQGSTTVAPAAAMNAIVAQTTDWATFFTLFDPDGGSGNTVKQAFAAWNNSQGDRYVYAVWDDSITPTLSNDEPTSLGNILKSINSSGSVVIYAPDSSLAAFVAGAVASIDFSEHNGRITLAFKGQGGMAATVTNQTVGDNLIANGYNFYGDYATANDRFVFFYPGQITGDFEWADSYVNQIWLNNAFQLALMTLLTEAKSVPYNPDGYALVRAACMDPIQQGLNFGAFSPGVPLSNLQAAEVKAAAGLDISSTLFAQGWYLQILPATAQVRGARRSPPMTFWYMDAGSIQKLALASIEIQ